MPTPDEDNRDKDTNPDPITGAPGSHPVGVGVGAAGAGAAGAAVGTAVGGPVGGAVGAVIGAVAGGLAGKAVGEAVDPTVEDAYWREHHRDQPFAKDRSYDDYAPAYRVGYEGYREGARYEDIEDDLRSKYEITSAPIPETAGTRARLRWEEARQATRAAWDRVARGDSRVRREDTNR
jgi:hypothetical protein